MKKFFALAFIAMVSFAFIGCLAEDDGSKADLKWSNDSGSNVADIKWVVGGVDKQSWSGETASGTETAFKEIKDLSGSGDCLDAGGNPATIQLGSGSTGVTTAVVDGANSATIQENAAADLVIYSTAKK